MLRLLLCAVTFGMVNSNMFYFTNVMQHVFVRTPFGPSAITFENIGSVDDYWDVSGTTVAAYVEIV
jgi:hypothetical protein